MFKNKFIVITRRIQMPFAKHKNMRDVCFEILNKKSSGELWELSVVWINITQKEPFYLPGKKNGSYAIEKLCIPKDIYARDFVESASPPLTLRNPKKRLPLVLLSRLTSQWRRIYAWLFVNSDASTQ